MCSRGTGRRAIRQSPEERSHPSLLQEQRARSASLLVPLPPGVSRRLAIRRSPQAGCPLLFADDEVPHTLPRRGVERGRPAPLLVRDRVWRAYKLSVSPTLLLGAAMLCVASARLDVLERDLARLRSRIARVRHPLASRPRTSVRAARGGLQHMDCDLVSGSAVLLCSSVESRRDRAVTLPWSRGNGPDVVGLHGMPRPSEPPPVSRPRSVSRLCLRMKGRTSLTNFFSL